MAKIDSQFNEETLLAALRAGSPAAFESVYRSNYPMILKMVKDNSGSENEAQDVFQETLFVLVKKVREPDFALSGKLSTYLFAVGRNIWFKRGRGIRGKTNSVEHEKFARMDLSIPENELEEVAEKDRMLDVLHEKMNELEPDCKQILSLSIQQNRSQKEIAEIMDYSPSFVKVKKFRCLKYLREKVRGLAGFKNLN